MAEENIIKFDSTFEYKLIYVFRINDGKHDGCLKIGDATIHTDKSWKELTPSCHELNFAAKKRIDEYTATAGISYDLLYTEIAVYMDSDPKSKHCGELRSFRDHKVHSVLKRSGIKNRFFDTGKKQNEWFVTSLDIAKAAIGAVKKGKNALENTSSTKNDPIIFRPEQKEAISQTVKRFKVTDKMLWNAKMRFGKTLCALEVAKEAGFKKTIILTHRPVVSDGWYEDFGKIFADDHNYEFASKTRGKTIHELVDEGKNFVYFASIQDLRGASAVGGRFDKDNEIYDLDWDFVVVDEAHEGTLTDLGQKVLNQVIEGKTQTAHVLELSGTPFNLLGDYNTEDIYTWDYIMEQQAKQDFALNHFGDSNPYEDLPKMNIFTYHLEKSFVGYMDIEDKAFNFREFFRTWTGEIEKDFKPVPSGARIGDFVHQDDIVKFLNLISQKNEKTNYPFSSEEYRKLFRHTLWILPGVKEAKAMSALLKKHDVFGFFNIVNVAGDGDEEVDSTDALTAVRSAFGSNPDDTYSITLSCGRLTTGVSVPEWTAVLMLAGSYSTAASQYLQTIFRVQTPANINGKTKENCYVFDFAPDRTLKMVAESVQLSAQAGKKDARAELALKQFLNFCPVIAIDETKMKEFRVSELLQALKKAYIDKVAKNGFDDNRLYNDELLKLDGLELDEFNKLKEIVGTSNQQKKPGDIDINNEGFTDEEYEEEEKAKKKKKKGQPLSSEEITRLEELKKKRKNRATAISILRGISIRIPLMVYGIDKDFNEDITVDSFSDSELIDDLSWNEFMPKGVTRELFRKFAKYYDKDVFVGACRRIRAISKSADELEPTERVKKIAQLFSTFKNPDKETVLTPWRVVNLHMVKGLGGYSFFNNDFHSEIEEPTFINHQGLTDRVFNKESKILEINSKTGLYPLYVAYTLFRIHLEAVPVEERTFEKKFSIWDEVLERQVFVICKTPMAKLITKRTIAGYRNVKVNARYFEDLTNQLKQVSKLETFIRKIHDGKKYWKVNEEKNMKFNAVVGNPPYQETHASTSDPAVYNYFLDAGYLISDVACFITPARFLFNVGKTPEIWNKKMLNDEHLKVVMYEPDCTKVFPSADIKGGVVVTLRDATKDFGKIGIFSDKTLLISAMKKVYCQNDFRCIDAQLYFQTKFNLTNVFLDFPELKSVIGSNGKEKRLTTGVFTKLERLFSEQPMEQGAKILGLVSNERKYRYIPMRYLLVEGNFDKYKVVIPKANGTGAFGETFSSPLILGPNEGYTQSFIGMGSFVRRNDAEKMLKYLKTKFLRAMLGILKVTHDNNSDVWKYVPALDVEKSKVDWAKSINEIDEQLFAIYHLSKDEKEFIKSSVQSML